MTTRYVLISANVTKSNDFVKKVNELLAKGYELYGSPSVSTTSDKEVVYQAMVLTK